MTEDRFQVLDFSQQQEIMRWQAASDLRASLRDLGMELSESSNFRNWEPPSSNQVREEMVARAFEVGKPISWGYDAQGLLTTIVVRVRETESDSGTPAAQDTGWSSGERPLPPGLE